MIEQTNSFWTQDEAITLCRLIECFCPKYGCHVALTGGCLYKDGGRKDLDILFYRIRQVKEIDLDGLFAALELIGITKQSGFGWVYKATGSNGRNIDMFFPESNGGDYDRKENSDMLHFHHYSTF